MTSQKKYASVVVALALGLVLVPSAPTTAASTRHGATPKAMARQAETVFLNRINSRNYRAAKKMTFYARDLNKLKRLRERGYRFGRPYSCGYAAPEGFYCLADVLKKGHSGDQVWMHVDGSYDKKPSTWKVWDVRVYDPL